MADVFLSYAREDSPFVKRLQQALSDQGRDVWVDWEDIPPSAEWLAEIAAAVEAADTFVFVLTPASLGSETCLYELKHAHENNKRIVPVVSRDVEAPHVPESLARLNWLFFREKDDFDTAFRTLIATIETDLGWVRAHTRLLVRAREWESHRQDTSYVLQGADLEEVESWLSRAADSKPRTTQLQMEYISASHRAGVAQQRRENRGFYLVATAYAALQVLVSYFVVFDDITETGLMYLSPLWVMGFVFGVFGLTVGRTSLKGSIVAGVVAGVLLYVFFIVLWPSL